MTDGVDAASVLLDLEGLAVARVERDAFGVRTAHLVTADETASACPSCGVLSTAVKERVRTRPRDVPYGPAPLRLVWHKRRWRCRTPGCGRASFTEQVGAVPARARLTVRLVEALAVAVAEQGRTVAEVASHFRVGWARVHRAYAQRVQPALDAPLPEVRVLGIDETRRGRPRWQREAVSGRWVMTAERWHTSFVDSAGSGGLLGQAPGRSAAAVIGWLQAQPEAWRAQVGYVTIDLSASYAAAVRAALPAAVLIADRFHLVRLANQTLTEVRQRVIREHLGRRGRKTDPAWRSRRRLLTGYERLRGETFVRMWNQLVDTGDPGVEILHAYIVKEELRSLLALSGTGASRTEIRRHLWTFYTRAASSTAPEVHRLAATVEAWWPAIEAAILTGHSNARCEAYHRLGRHEGRHAYGFRNPDNQRRRIRWRCTRQHRRASATITGMPGQVR